MTKSRKRMLLSSIAMLLVALVALGSATYAWFTINKQVTANGMSVTAATAAGLQITKTNGTGNTPWARDVSFSAWGTGQNAPTSAVLSPVSLQYALNSALGTNGYYTDDAKDDGAYTSSDIADKAGTGSWKAAAVPAFPTTLDGTGEAKNKTNYFAAYRVGIRSSGDAISNVKMTLNYTAAEEEDAENKSSDFIRVVVVEEGTTSKVVACYGNGADATKPIKNTNPEIDTASQATTTLVVNNITAPAKNTESDSAGKYYTIYTWFEGQDADCNDNHQALTGSIDIKFEIVPTV